MPSHYEVIERWASQIDGAPCTKSMRGCHIFANGPTIYSYGTHFPMAEIMDGFVLVNGDTFSSTTSRHQSKVRGALRGHRHAIIPFSALSAANIDRQSIRPLDIQPDTVSTIERKFTLAQMRTKASDQWSEAPQAAGFNLPRPKYPDAINYSLRTHVEQQRDYPHGSPQRVQLESEYRAEVAKWHEAKRRSARYATAFLEDGEPIERRGDYYVLPVQRHWLGESVFTATVIDRVVFRTSDGYRDEKLRRRKARFLSAFDHNELTETYFLCELPRDSRAETVAQAFDDLAPAIVKRALAMDIDVKRQGDIFAIPCELPSEITRPAPWKRGHNARLWHNGQRPHPCRLLGTDHTVTEVLRPGTGETYARGVMRHEPSFRAPDHAKIRLDGWHLIVPNTCPR